MDEIDNLIEEYKDLKILNVVGIDENGEDLFHIDLELAKIHAPAFYESLIEDVDNDLLSLYNEGLVGVEYDENLEATFYLTEKGEQYVKENLL